MRKFNLIIQDNHPIIKDGDNFILVDTGSPVTIQKDLNFSFNEQNHSVKTEYGGASIHKVAQYVQYPITTLLGTDIISGFKVLFDYKDGEITFFEPNEPVEFNGALVPISSYSGIPVFEATTEVGKIKFFLDSGAKLSYLNSELTTNMKRFGNDTDFHLSIGEYSTTTFESKIQINGSQLFCIFGTLPHKIATLLNTIKGIMGSDFFFQRKILLDISNSNMKII